MESDLPKRKAIKVTPFYIHSTHANPFGDASNNAVIVKEKVRYEYEDGSVEWKPRLKVWRDPERDFFVTLPQFRDHKYKKEFESLDKLERFRCKDTELKDAVANALGIPLWRVKYQSVRSLCDSPYLYGADIDTETIIKQEYAKKQPEGITPPITVGALDIETEVIGEKRINVITFIAEHEIYTAALKDFCRIYKESSETFIQATREDCIKRVEEIIGSNLKEHGFNLHFLICDTEAQLLKTIFRAIHESKVDFIGIWNMPFDIPKIIERAEKLHIKITDLFCPKYLPPEYRYAKYRPDNNPNAQHITDKWAWMSAASCSQFYDAMCLYARLRKHEGRDVSYSLDYISDKEIGQGKLHLGEVTNHRYEQTYHFLDYIAYNINDVVIMMLMEFKNKDVESMVGLTPSSLYSNFSKQTLMVRDNSYVYALSKGACIATASLKMLTDYEAAMPKAGGTVLPPEKAVGVGSVSVEGLGYNTQIVLMVNDLDEKSMYPCTIRAFNLSKETRHCTVLGINGYDKSAIETFGTAVNNPIGSSVQLCTTFLGLPSYEEMLKLVEDKIQNA